MAVLPILTYPDPRLQRVAEPVIDFGQNFQTLVDDLLATLRVSAHGVGMAATQVGVLQRLVIVDVSSKANIKHHGLQVLVNPEILDWQGFASGREGCLSVPDYIGTVIRAKKIQLKAQDRHGQWREYAMEGYEARAVQHEIDHLDGKLFLDRLVSKKRDLMLRQFI
jgi:peptide deformylase